jgi:N utilization substance protein B
MNKISTKTVARIAAVQALYQYNISGSKDPIDKIISDINNYYMHSDGVNDAIYDISEDAKSAPKVKLNLNHFTGLVKQTIDRMEDIDKFIESRLIKTKFESLHITLLSILRVAIAELYYFPEVPYKVVINEFTNIASDMLTDNEIAFVNSMLDAAYKEKGYKKDEYIAPKK